MKEKLLNTLLIIFSLFGYLEWGADSSTFLFEGEYEVLSNLLIKPDTVIHPFTMIPFLGQILLFATLFQKKPNKIMTYIAIVCLGLLLGFMFFIGITRINFKILISTLPFLVTATYTVFHLRKQKGDK
ncbi:hypothetical protein [Pedobacter sp.]|uniref:hypothetical protein n=1 Tax=Pedobacter sp. TaxID=1411316 RepID=UPI00396C4BF9